MTEEESLMLSVDTYSLKFDVLCLHRWAWDQKLIRKPRPIDEENRQKTANALFNTLCSQALKQKGLVFESKNQGDSLVLTLLALGRWLDQVRQQEGLPLITKHTSPTEAAPTITLTYKEGHIHRRVALYQSLLSDLEVYESLARKWSKQGVSSPFGQKLPRRTRRRKA